MKELVETLIGEFKDKEYAHSYLEEFSNMEIAAQIKILREQRSLTQKELAVLAEMKQERISTLEDVNYDSWTVKTLRKLARAFDVGIKISFENVSSRILDIDNLSKNELERTSRNEDLESIAIHGFSSEWGGSVVSITNSQRIPPKSVSANDDWNSFPQLQTTVIKLCANQI